MSDKPFETVDPEALANVAGGASRVSARASGSSDQLTMMLTQITSSIKDLANKPSGGMDPMMLMMMMMGGGGSGAAAAAPPAAAASVAAPPAINVSVAGGGGGGRGKKGW